MKLTREVKIGLFSTFLTLTAFALSSNAIPPLVVTIADEFQMRYETFGGYIILLQFSFYAVASVVGGWAADRFGLSNRSMVISGIFILGLMLMIGSVFRSFGWFIVWAIPLGFTGGLVETFSSIMICRFGGTQSSKMLNVSQIFFCIGAFFAPFFVGQILGFDISWRVAFVCLGLIIVLIGLKFTYFTKTLKEPHVELPPSSAGAETSKETAVRPNLLSDRLFYLLTGALFLYVLVEASLAVWIPSYFETHLGVPAGSAAWRLSIFWLGLVSGRLLMLVLRGRWTLWPAVLIGSFGMIAVNIWLAFPQSPAFATALVFLAGLVAGPIWPIIVTLSQHLRGSAQFTAAVIASGALGAGLGPFAISWVIKHLGMQAFFPTLALIGLLLSGTLLLARKYRTISA